MLTAVALIIFNRPESTKRVFAEIAKARPPKLLVIADGPRPDRPDDVKNCAAATAVIERVDWECEVLKNYSNANMGCGRRVSTGITWVFEHIEEAIILEDDCIPHPTFFPFCEELLEKYREDERVMQISGNNFQFGCKAVPYSYFFSYQNIPCWGWATWRRAWRHFDYTLRLWPMLRDTSWLLDIVKDTRAAEHLARMFDGAYAFTGVEPGQGRDVPTDLRHRRKLTKLFDSLVKVGLIDPGRGVASGLPGEYNTWDYQWSFACWAQNGLAVFPNRTLVSNIGFGSDATHTHSTDDRRAYLSTEAMVFPLRHPPFVVTDSKAEQRVVEAVYVFHTKPVTFYQRLLERHPSLKSPRLFARRLGQKCFAPVRRISKSNFFTSFSCWRRS
jgi:hypothetical protein